MSKVASGKKKARVFYSQGPKVDEQVKCQGRGLTKKERRGEVQPQG